MPLFSFLRRIVRLSGHRRKSRGVVAEDRAARWLKHRGVKIITRNYRCRQGEIDLIGFDGRTLVFFEVRLRENVNFGSAASSVTLYKQARIVKAARHYLAQHPEAARRESRFDCVLLTTLDDGLKVRTGNSMCDDCEWLRNAFDVDAR